MSSQEEQLAQLQLAAVRDPRNGEIRYLLGASLAQLKRYDEALLELSAAVALDPLLHVARLQLGLLHLTMAQLDHAITVLAPLESLDDGSALKHFKRGLEALAVDQFDTAIANLEQGIQLNTENEPLNTDMRMLIQHIEEKRRESEATVPDEQSFVHTDFSLYGVTRH